MAIAGFNANYYVQTYPDVLVAISQGIYKSAEEHFVKNGAKEGRNPNANFDSKYYLANNQDVLQAVASGAIASAYDHYIAYGYKEGRIPSAALASFNGQAYLDANADVKTAGYTAATALGHYVLFGAAENRTGGGNTQQQVTGNYTGTTGDDTVTPAGGQTNAIRVEGGQQGAKGDTLVVTSGSAASFQVLDLSNVTGDQNRTVDTQNAKVGPVVQGFENVDATSATINMNITAIDRTSVTNTGGVASTISGSVIQGGTGRDTIIGGAGNDSLVGNDGNDSITGGAGADSIYGGVGNDTLLGGAGNDLIEDGAGDDSVTGDAGNDTINVGSGTNFVDGGADNDTITLKADQATATTVSTILGGSGDDTIVLNDAAITAASRVSVSGGVGNDTITAGLGVETINGGAGNDTVIVAASNIGTTDVFNGNDGQDIIQLQIPSGSGTNTFVFQSLGATAAASQFNGFEAISLVDSSGNTNAKQYKIILTDTFIAQNFVNGSFLIDARGLPGGSNVVIDFSQLTSASAARFTANAFRVLASPSTDVRDQNNVTITNTYAVNTSNSVLGTTAAFLIFAGDTTVTAGTAAAYNTDRTVNTNGQAAYTTTGGTAETTVSTGGYDFTLTAANAVLTNALNDGKNVNPTTGLLTSSGNAINAGTFLGGATIVDTTVGDGDRLDATLTAATTPSAIVNIETLNLTSYAAGGLDFSKLTNAQTINITGQSFAGTNLAATQTVNLNSIITGGATSFALAANSGADAITLNLQDVATTLTLGTAGNTYETVNIAASGTNTLAFGVNALNGGNAGTYLITGAGNLTINDSDTSNNSTINASALTGNLTYSQLVNHSTTITSGSGNDTFTFNGTGTLTNADNVNAGAGTDTVVISGGGAIAATDFDNVSNIEVITVANTVNSIAITTKDTLVSASATLTLNASTLTTGTLTFNGAAELDGGKFSITGGAAADTITGGNGADTITGGNGADVITGGIGADSIILTETTAAADIVAYSALVANVASEGGDTITGFTATGTADVLRFTDDATNYNLGNADNTVTAVVAAGGVGLAASELVINTTKLASLAAVQANLATQVGMVTAGNGVLLVSGDASNTYVFHDSNGSTAGGVTLVATLVGVDVSTVTAANFAFV